MKPPITAAKLRISLKNTRRSATLRNPDPVPLVILALAADAAASAASHDFVLGRGVRAQERVGDLIGGLSEVPAAMAVALANPRALAWACARARGGAPARRWERAGWTR